MIFVRCEKCGKNLLERLPSGLFVFKFGKKEGGKPIVDMKIHVSIKMKCIRRSCGHENVLHYFPNSNE